MIKRAFIVFNLTWSLFTTHHSLAQLVDKIPAAIPNKVQPYHYTFYITPFNSTNKSASQAAESI
jgi:hypothetical protein